MGLDGSKPVTKIAEEAPTVAFQEEKDPSTHPEGRTADGMGSAMRMGTTLVSTTLIGLGMGYFLDQWLDTRPWMMLLFFLFGTVAGFRDVYRIANSKQT